MIRSAESVLSSFAPSRGTAAPPAPASPSRLASDSFAREAPAGRSRAGTAVNQAIFETAKGTVPTPAAFTLGSIEDIWVNDTDPEDEAVDKVIELLADAHQEISLQTFYFKYDQPAAQRLLAALAKKQAENPDFQVHIAYNRDFNPLGTTMEEALQQYGVKADVAIYAGAVSRKSNHTKMFVLDGRDAVIGGDNIDNPAERDVMVHLRGPVVDSLLRDFDEAWSTSKRWINGTRTPPTHRKGLGTVSSQPLVPMTLLTKQGVAWVGDYANNDADQGLLAAMNAAQRLIKVASPNLNDTRVWDALEASAKRGVKVEIMLPQNFKAVGPLFDRSTNRAVPRFLAQLPEAARQNVELRWFAEDGKTPGDSHTKFLSVDGEWAYVGSQNMDNQAWAFSREVGIGVDDATQVQRLEDAMFDADWATSIPAELRPIDAVMPLPARNWGERLARFFIPALPNLPTDGR
ncbi:MAG TPA: phosphatidylserine/phosphatidylglycerophosphate/cardiolipin synthase family protein [Stenomitos sp.]